MNGFLTKVAFDAAHSRKNELPPHPERRPFRSMVGLAMKIGLGLGLGFGLAFLAGFGIFLASLDRGETPPSGRSDAIVALTGGAQRIEDAIELLARGYAGRLLITGLNERTSRDQIARLNPGQHALFACCVDLDYRARNTIGNAIETRRWAKAHGFSSLIVVTSHYHMPRALLELNHALPSSRLIPFAVVTSASTTQGWSNPAALRLAFVEYAKFIAVWVRTKLESDPESSVFTNMFTNTNAPMVRAKTGA